MFSIAGIENALVKRGGAVHAILRAGSRGIWKLSNVFSRANLDPFLDRSILALNETGEVGQILNVGAGGLVAEKLRGLRAQVTSVDSDPDRNPDIVADVCDMKFLADESVDAVFLIEVLEHVKTPWLAVEEIFRVLKPGGRLFMSTPFLFEIHSAPTDYYRFTRCGLEYLLREFRSVDVHERNGYLASTIVPAVRLTQSRRMPDLPLGLLFLALAFLTYPVVFLLDRGIRTKAATTGYTAVAIK